MAGGVWGNSVRHDVLVFPKSSLHRVSRPELVFQDIQGVAAALTLNLLDQSRVHLIPRYWGQAFVDNAWHTPPKGSLSRHRMNE